jgi:hypothetical protein
MSNIKINISGGTVLITALLCILKLTGILTISWWWCFCLFWLPFAIVLALLGLLFIICVPYIIYLIIKK